MEEGESEFAASTQEGGERHGTNIAALSGNIGGERQNMYFAKYLNILIMKELTTAVNDNLDKISLVKSNILKNEDKIEKMISSMGLAHK